MTMEFLRPETGFDADRDEAPEYAEYDADQENHLWLNLYVHLHRFRCFVSAGCIGERDYIPLHYFYPVPDREMNGFRAILSEVFARRRKQGAWLEVEKRRLGIDPEMAFREAGRKFLERQAGRNAVLPRSSATVLTNRGKYPHPFENALARILESGASPVIVGSIGKNRPDETAPYWYELSRGRFGSINLPPETLLILAGSVPPEALPASLISMLCLWNLQSETQFALSPGQY